MSTLFGMMLRLRFCREGPTDSSHPANPPTRFLIENSGKSPSGLESEFRFHICDSLSLDFWSHICDVDSSQFASLDSLSTDSLSLDSRKCGLVPHL